jgi:LCCL domain
MKVIQELAAYFDRRGRLSAEQAKRLHEQGLLAADAPRSLTDYCDRIGASYFFRVTGSNEGSLWGTDVYTGDSDLAAAAVHAGVLKAGETAVVRVRVVAPPASFTGSARHGVVSQDFERFGTAYRVEAIQAPERP